MVEYGNEADHCPPVEVEKDPDEIRDELEEYIDNNKDWMERAYARAEKAKVGDKINCAGCGNIITKEFYQQKFCRVKKKKRKNRNSPCKDRYWNVVDERLLRDHYLRRC